MKSGVGYFQSPKKIYGGHSPQTISAIGSGHCGGKIMRWNWAEQQKLSRYLTKYAFLRIIYTLSIYSLGCIQTSWVMPPTFDVVVGAFIADAASGFYSAPQCSHCKRCTSYGNSICLSACPSVRNTPVLCQNGGM